MLDQACQVNLEELQAFKKPAAGELDLVFSSQDS